MKYLFRSLGMLLLAGTLATAQIAPTSRASQRAANRQALRDARRTEAPYKDSHLDVTRQQLRRGGSEGPRVAPDEPRFDRDGTPHAAAPKFLGRPRHKAKTEPAPQLRS